MHASSYENMRACYERFVKGDFADARERVVVLDLGARDVGGSYRTIFSGTGFHYIGADLSEGLGVDLLMEEAHTIPLPEASVDLVLCGRMLERCEMFWRLFAEMRRVVRPDGYIVLVASSAGEGDAADLYRFRPATFAALAAYADARLVELWRDDREPWQDLVGVFRAASRGVGRPSGALPAHGGPVPALGEEAYHADQTRPATRGSAEEETQSTGMHYRTFLTRLHAELAPRGYLEIGIRQGHSLALAACPAIGIDPAPNVTQTQQPDTRVAASTSDDFFREHRAGVGLPVDLAFIDGMHAFEYALRDFINIERLSHPASMVAVDDVLPNHPLQARRVRQTVTWTGDIWKIASCLRESRPDLTLVLVDTEPTGLLLIAGLDRTNESLWRGYNSIVEPYAVTQVRETPDFVPAGILTREGALQPDDPRLAAFLALMRGARESGATTAQVKAELAAWSAPVLPGQEP